LQTHCAARVNLNAAFSRHAFQVFSPSNLMKNVFVRASEWDGNCGAKMEKQQKKKQILGRGI
jgi:hypothetical protein